MKIALIRGTEATGLNEELVERFSTILQALTSGRKINCDKFEEYAMDTAKLYVEKYKWWRMSPTVHKVLLHGAAVIRSLIVPIGQLSEEALEAGNKEFKKIREFHSRKTSRKDNCEDIMHHLLALSDPSITELRVLQDKKHLELSEQAKELLEED